VMVGIHVWGGGQNGEEAVTKLAEVIRAGKLKGLREVRLCLSNQLSRAGGEAIGEAITHEGASLNSLEEMDFASCATRAVDALLEGLSRGPHSLPSLHTLKCSHWDRIPTQTARSLSALVSGGRVPSLRHLSVDLSGVGQEGVRPFAAALRSPHVFELRRLDVRFKSIYPANAVTAVGVFSTALSSGHLRRLEELCVRGLYMIEDVRALCVGLGSGQLSSLRELRFSGSSFWVFFGVEGGRALSEVVVAEKLPSLKTLGAFEMALTDNGLRALIERWMSHPAPPSSTSSTYRAIS